MYPISGRWSPPFVCVMYVLGLGIGAVLPPCPQLIKPCLNTHIHLLGKHYKSNKETTSVTSEIQVTKPVSQDLNVSRSICAAFASDLQIIIKTFFGLFLLYQVH